MATKPTRKAPAKASPATSATGAPDAASPAKAAKAARTQRSAPAAAEAPAPGAGAAGEAEHVPMNRAERRAKGRGKSVAQIPTGRGKVSGGHGPAHTQRNWANRRTG